MPTIAVLAARPAYRRSNVNPSAPAEMTSLTAAQATEEIRTHVRRDARNRSTQAAPYGAVILLQGEDVIRLEPAQDVMPKYLSAAQAEQLMDLAAVTDEARYVPEAGGVSICSRWRRIPPAATNRLVRHGWVYEAHGVVRVSLAGVVALTWRQCKTGGVPAGQWADLIAESLVDVYTPEFDQD